MNSSINNAVGAFFNSGKQNFDPAVDGIIRPKG
jgi:hypothetical protein